MFFVVKVTILLRGSYGLIEREFRSRQEGVTIPSRGSYNAVEREPMSKNGTLLDVIAAKRPSW